MISAPQNAKPRMVSVRWGGIFMALAALSIVPGLCFSFYYSSKAFSDKMADLKHFGVGAVGIIENLYEKDYKYGKGYHVIYRFYPNALDGIGRSNVLHNDDILVKQIDDAKVFSRLHIGDKIPVVYLKDRPYINRSNIDFWIQNNDDNTQNQNFWRILGILMLFGEAIFCIWYGTKLWPRYFLLKNGALAKALILSLSERGARSFRIMSVKYEYTDNNSLMFQGSQGDIYKMPTSSFDNYSVRQRIARDFPVAIYDPKSPWKSVLYPVNGFKCPEMDREVDEMIASSKTEVANSDTTH